MRSPFGLSSSSLALLPFVFVVGCSGARSGPVDAVRNYSAALREQRYADAYRMLSAEARSSLSYEEYEHIARETPEEVRETTHWLDQVDPNGPVTARLDLTNGESVGLVEESGEWRLDPAALDFYGQHSPRQTVRSFARALRRGRYDVLLRFVPHHLLEGMTAESLRTAWQGAANGNDVQSMVNDLERGLGEGRPIEIVGDRATMAYGIMGRRVMQLTREDGVWKVEDPE